MDYKSLLNDKQYAAVSTDSQYVRIVAGAGSGKTRVLTYRVSYLVSERKVSPSRILAIAFTNKVAQEMRERASKLLEELMGRVPTIQIRTFHAFCAYFLRLECHAVNYPQGFTIYDEEDSKKLMQLCAKELGYKKGDQMVKDAIHYIRNKKGKGLYPEDITLGKGTSFEEKTYIQIYSLYEQKKENFLAFDFDDLLLKTIQILVGFPEIRDHWRNKFDHILVDEFQDTNDIQFKLLTLLSRSDTNIYVVGDPDQTIYTWRGANQKIILDFEKTFQGAETIILNENYRSTKTILNAANKLIANNKNRVPKDLFTNGEEGAPIEAYIAPRQEGEASWVASKIASLGKNHIGKNGKPDYSHIAVLYRSSYLTRPFESEFKDRAIPYKIFGGVRFYERMEVKDVLAYFNLMLNPNDNVAFERIANVPKRGVGDTSLDLLRDEARNAGVSEYDYMLHYNQYADNSSLKSRVTGALGKMIEAMEKTKKKLDENLEAYNSVLRDFIVEIGYLEFIAAEQDPDEDRVGNVNALFDDITHFIEKNPDATFEEYLQNVSLLTAQDDMDGGNFVTLMTVHVAKGLEFDDVFVIGLNEGSFPSRRSVSEKEDGEEEERRLAYVAMTRAKKHLYLSCNTGYSFQEDGNLEVSRFFSEAGVKLPHTQNYYSDHYFNKGYGKNTYKSASNTNKTHIHSIFFDGDNYSPFEDEKEVEKKEKKETPAQVYNDVTNWRVGDRVNHQTFGEGTVTQIINDKMMVVHFDKEGNKTLLSNHKFLSRIKSVGGEA